jgi:hypothetical protein
MPWLRGMDGATAPFNQTIGFPVEVRLKTFPNGVRVARTPIAEIETLYESSAQQGAQVYSSGQNALAAFSAKVFDLTVILDATATTADTVTFGLADLDVQLDLAGMSLNGATVSAIDGKISVRILRDWGQYEIFVNGGQVVTTSVHPFDPNDASVSMTGDGSIALVSADFHELARVWPGEAATSSVIIDDSDAASVYDGAWTVANEGRYFKASARVGSVDQSFEVPFSGTRVEWWGLKNADLGMADVFIDDVLVAAGVDAYSQRRENALLYSQGGLAPGAHTFRVVATGQQNPASSANFLVHDYIIAFVDP